MAASSMLSTADVMEVVRKIAFLFLQKLSGDWNQRVGQISQVDKA